jgi:hypothetical protein
VQELIVAVGISIVGNVATKLLKKWFGELGHATFCKRKGISTYF